MTLHSSEKGHDVRQLELGNFEKVILGLSAAFAIWMGATTYESSVRLSVIESQLDGISKVTDQANTDRYTRIDANADARNLVTLMNAMDRRVSYLESKHQGN
tara:strand:- start:4948 stop:5253 length:306 start_codon:yes stop_codon:yes gene_type:complete